MQFSFSTFASAVGDARRGGVSARIGIWIWLTGISANAAFGQQTAMSTQMRRAITACDASAVIELLETGESPEARDWQDHTGLMAAAAADCSQGIEYLLAAGAAPNATLPDGLTALMLAASAGAETSAVSLLAGGADPAIATPSGDRAADFARRSGHLDLANQLAELEDPYIPRQLVLPLAWAVVVQGGRTPLDEQTVARLWGDSGSWTSRHWRCETTSDSMVVRFHDYRLQWNAIWPDRGRLHLEVLSYEIAEPIPCGDVGSDALEGARWAGQDVSVRLFRVTAVQSTPDGGISAHLDVGPSMAMCYGSCREEAPAAFRGTLRAPSQADGAGLLLQGPPDAIRSTDGALRLESASQP